MPFEYEALVGHLYVVGGRAISATPPGALVEVAPRKAARGRETDTIFTLVLPSRDLVAPAAFYEQMAALTAERYFNSTGSVTAGLRTVYGHINDNLFDHNARNPQRYEASMLCAVLRGSDLYLSRVGSGVGLLRHNGETHPFPADFGNDEALFGAPLGVHPSPDVKMAMYQVTNGTRLVLSDASLADIDMENVRTALALPDIGDVLVALKDQIRSQITLTLIEFVPPEQPTPLPVREAESTAAVAAAPSETRSATAEKPATAVSTVAEAPPREAGKLRLSEARSNNVKRAVSDVAVGAGKALEGVNNTLDKVVPLPKEGQRSWMSTPAAAGLAVLIPVLVVVLVVILWLSRTGESEFDQCVNEANEAAQMARGVASNDVTGTLAAWNAVLVFVDQCNTIRPNDPTMSGLTREARTVLDALLQISRRPTAVIDTLPSASLTRGVLQGEDLYVLDDGNDLVYRVTLPTEGTGAGSHVAIPGMRRQATVNQFTIGDIFDIAWADEGGVSQGSVITALDRNGVLVDCSPTFIQNCSAQQLNIDTWNAPVAMQFWQGRLYVLDPAANQIWRYDPSGSAYPNVPIEYFVGEGRPDIRTAVDFAIDTPGSIYILLSDGTVARYNAGLPEPFTLDAFPTEDAMRSADSMFLNTNPIAQNIYFVDRTNRTIYVTTYRGTFVDSYRAEDESMFTEIAHVVEDSNKRIIYVMSGNSVLAFRRGTPSAQQQ